MIASAVGCILYLANSFQQHTYLTCGEKVKQLDNLKCDLTYGFSDQRLADVFMCNKNSN